jgi:hypothetical protein
MADEQVRKEQGASQDPLPCYSGSMARQTNRRLHWLIPLGLLVGIVAGNVLLWPSRTSKPPAQPGEELDLGEIEKTDPPSR